jgi:hypothetical protein
MARCVTCKFLSLAVEQQVAGPVLRLLTVEQVAVEQVECKIFLPHLFLGQQHLPLVLLAVEVVAMVEMGALLLFSST